MVNVNNSQRDFQTLPHYCPQAVELFSDLAKRLLARLGIAPDFELLLRDLMHNAVKFALRTIISIRGASLQTRMFDRQELPHPLCSLEFTATRELHAAASDLARG